jgi:hypothetical protein
VAAGGASLAEGARHVKRVSNGAGQPPDCCLQAAVHGWAARLATAGYAAGLARHDGRKQPQQ